MDEPNLITSSKSQRVLVEGHPLSIEIYRIDTEPMWSLEIVDEDGTSTVWEDLFATDADALEEAFKTINEEGIGAFRDNINVVPFPKK